jgi:hypothetical protein
MVSGIYAQNLTPSLEPFKYLLGSWSFKREQTQFLEVWELQDSLTLIGRGYKINQGDSSLLETVLLKSVGDGVYYIPFVENQNIGMTVKFRLVSSRNHTYVFENKEHDFPQRVVYEIKGKDELLAWIEGVKDGKILREDFPYKREASARRPN